MEAKCSFHTCTSIGTGCKPDILKYPAPKTAELLRADAPTLRLFEVLNGNAFFSTIGPLKNMKSLGINTNTEFQDIFLSLNKSFFLSLQNVPSGAVTTRQPSSAIETALRVAVIWGI
eukprot:s3247_g9.t1